MLLEKFGDAICADALVGGAFEAALVDLIDKIGVACLPVGKAFDAETVAERCAEGRGDCEILANDDGAMNRFVWLGCVLSKPARTPLA